MASYLYNKQQLGKVIKKEISDNLKLSLGKIKNKIVVLSGKGGVGKSTVATNVAMSLAMKGFKTGLLDVDIHGPSVPTLLGIEDQRVSAENGMLIPVNCIENLKVISVGLLLGEKTEPIIWRGPMKMKMIEQMVADVDWGELDYLIVDCPPGTGDEPLSIIQIMGEITGCLIVTTPQKLSVFDVKKSVNFCKKLNAKILGVIENMSGFVCPDCHKVVNIFGTGGGEKMALEMDVPFLGAIPIEKDIVDSGDAGKPFVASLSGSVTAQKLEKIIESITNLK